MTQARRLAAALSLALVGIAAVAPGPDGPPRLTLRNSRPDDPRPRFEFEVSGVDPATRDAIENDPGRLAEVVTVDTVVDPSGQGDDRTPLLGSCRFDAVRGVIRFRSRFPMEPGVRYRAAYRPLGSKANAAAIEHGLPKPPPETPSTVVTRVAPAADVLPENLLKFYVEFSAPMGRGEAYEHVRLLDGSGKPLDLPFLELGEELWDPRGMRFTLLFDPGRIKSGLRPRDELGPVLEAGKRYTLVVDRGWRDAAGRPLKAESRKTFRVGPPDTTPPDPSTWTLDRPDAGTRAPVVARFPEPLDRAMLGRVLGVADRRGRPVAGAVAVGDGETSWSFTPEVAWQPGGYVLRVGRALEDLAGNSVGRPFEVDVFQKVERRETAETVELPFTVGPR